MNALRQLSKIALFDCGVIRSIRLWCNSASTPRVALRAKALGRVSIVAFIFGLVGCGIDPEHRFVITADFTGQLDPEREHQIHVHRRTFDVGGVVGHETLLKQKISTGLNVIEGEIAKPTVVRIDLQGIIPWSEVVISVAETAAILEPGQVLRLDYRGRYRGMIATGSGKHSEFVERWMLSDEYLGKSDELAELANEMLANQSGRPPRDSADEDQSTSSKESNEATAKISELHGRTTGESESDALDHSANSRSSGCRTAPEPTVYVIPTVNQPKHQRISEERRDFRARTLTRLAETAEDPIDALLAVELGGLGRTQEDLIYLDELATRLDSETVAERISPRRNIVEDRILRLDTQRSLESGYFAPDFSLPSRRGTEVSLRSVLGKNEMVLLNVWASWCESCIEMFPRLEEIYSDFRDYGFEIVSASVDRHPENWERALEENDTPWINVRENIDFSGPMAWSYGIWLVPKQYLLNSEGCIVGKNLSVNELKENLSNVFEPRDRLDGSQSRYDQK